jgi:hypothetical protein
MRPRYGGRMSPEAATRAVTCEGCGWFVLQVSTVMQAAERAVEHLEAIGCSADSILISPVGRP